MLDKIKNNAKYVLSLRKKNRKSKIMILIILVLLNLAGITFAKYLSDYYSNKVMALAKDFYFTSDFLSAGNMEHELKNWDTKIDYTFMIDAKNWIDDLKISTSPITYTIHVSDTCTYKVNASEGTGPFTLPKDIKQTDKIIVTVPNGSTLHNDTVEVSITAKMGSSTGYEKTITGSFHLNKKTDIFEYAIEKNSEYIDVLIGSDATNTFTVTYPSSLKPDNTIEELKASKDGSAAFQIDKDKSRLLRFFITGELKDQLTITATGRTVKFDLSTMQEVN